jgi:hypothetical protein
MPLGPTPRHWPAGPLERTCAYAAGRTPVSFSYVSLFLCLGLLKTQSQTGEGRVRLLCSSCVVAVILVAGCPSMSGLMLESGALSSSPI